MHPMKNKVYPVTYSPDRWKYVTNIGKTRWGLNTKYAVIPPYMSEATAPWNTQCTSLFKDRVRRSQCDFGKLPLNCLYLA